MLLDHLDVRVVAIELHGGQIEGHGIVALVPDRDQAAGNCQRQLQAALILPNTACLLEVMAGAVTVRVYIVEHITCTVRQRLPVQALMIVGFPALADAEGIVIPVAAVVEMAEGHGEDIAVA